MHVGCPFSMDGDQWDMLVQYQEECNVKNMIDQLTIVRNVITKLNKYGHGGKLGAKAKFYVFT